MVLQANNPGGRNFRVSQVSDHTTSHLDTAEVTKPEGLNSFSYLPSIYGVSKSKLGSEASADLRAVRRGLGAVPNLPGKKPVLMGSYRRTKQLGSGLIPSGTSVYKVASGIHLVDPIKAKELLRDRSTESQIQLNHQDFSSKKLHILRKGMGYLQDEIATKNDSKPSTQQHQSLQEKSARKQTTTE